MKKLCGFVTAGIFFVAGSAFVISNSGHHNIAVYSKKIVTGTIEGAIEPAESAKRVWAISSAADSAQSAPAMGKFSIPVKAGTWKIIVEAAAPYKDAVVDNLVVEEGKSTNVGVITLSQ